MIDSPSTNRLLDPAGTIRAVHLGPVGYRDGLHLQERLVRARAAGACGDWLLFPDHPPVLTVGRGASEGSLKASPHDLERAGIELFEVARGGDITWHGPGQLVGYPICHLDRVGRDLHRFLRALELVIQDALATFGIESRSVPGRTGVWAGEKKIASIGVAVRRWVSYHGFALNVAPDLAAFDLIHPCGLRDIHMTSMAAELGEAPDLAAVRRIVAEAVRVRLGFAELAWGELGEVLQVAAAARDVAPTATEHAASAGGAP